MIDKAAWHSVRAFSRAIVAKDLELCVEGLEWIPTKGPVLIAARHYHHLYDGCALMATVPRQMQVLVGLDWIDRPMTLRAMEAACRSAGWPVVFRDTTEVNRAVWLPSLRKALAESLVVLRADRVLLVFPEGHPTIDPHGSPKTSDEEFLTFHPGFAHIALDAWKAGIPVSLIPAGFDYAHADRWRVSLRFGQPVEPDLSVRPTVLAADVQQRVMLLSNPDSPNAGTLC